MIDESAQIFTGSEADQHKARALAKLLKLARKANANMVVIGQDGKGVDASYSKDGTGELSGRIAVRRLAASGL